MKNKKQIIFYIVGIILILFLIAEIFIFFLEGLDMLRDLYRSCEYLKDFTIFHLEIFQIILSFTFQCFNIFAIFTIGANKNNIVDMKDEINYIKKVCDIKYDELNNYKEEEGAVIEESELDDIFSYCTKCGKALKEGEKCEDLHIDVLENISFCDHCGYQLFPEDMVCPNCKIKIKKDT